MSKNNVKVTVKLVDGFSKTLKRLEKQLDKIDKKTVAPKFDFDDNGQIEKLKSELKSIEDTVNVKLNLIGEEKLKKTHANIERLSGVENVYVKTHDSELTRTLAKQKALQRRRKVKNRLAAQNDFMGRVDSFTSRSRRAQGSFAQSRTRAKEAASKSRFRLSDLFYADSKFRKKGGPVGGVTGMDFDDLGRRFGDGQGRRRRRGLLGGLVGLLSGAGGGGGLPGKGFFRGGDDGEPSTARRVSNGLLRLIPRGQLSQDLAAFFMPFQFAAIVAGLGAITAAAAPAIAGISALALGILGFGENAADSLKLAEVRLRIFGRELHKVFKPVQQTFAPFVDQWFKTLPHSLSRELSEPLQGMVVWMPTVEQIGSGLLGWTRDFLNLMNSLEPIVSRIVMQMGADSGDALLRFFEWLVLELDQNYDLLKDTLGAFKELAIFIYRVSLLWTQAIANLAPLISGLGKFINMIASSPVLGTIVAWTMSLAILAGVVIRIMGLFAALSGFIGGTFLGTVLSALGAKIAATWAWFAALSAAAKAAALTVGILTLGVGVLAGLAAMGAVSGALGSSNPGKNGFDGYSRGMGTNQTGSAAVGGNTINIYGNPDNTTVQQFKDMFPGEYETEARVNNRMTQG